MSNTSTSNNRQTFINGGRVSVFVGWVWPNFYEKLFQKLFMCNKDIPRHNLGENYIFSMI